MQQTALPRCDTARRTAYSEQLFCREVALPHLPTVRQNQPQNYPVSDTIRTGHPRLSILPDALTRRVISVVQSAIYRYSLDAGYVSKFRRLFAKT